LFAKANQFFSRPIAKLERVRPSFGSATKKTSGFIRHVEHELNLNSNYSHLRYSSAMDGNQRTQMVEPSASAAPNASVEKPFVLANASRRTGDTANDPSEMFRTLAQMAKGESGTIQSLACSTAFGSLDALVTRRLMELGFLPGAQLTVVGFGLLGRDPIAVKLGATKFALRRVEANKIIVAPDAPSVMA
jgi:ferrous iron transport protein A